MDFNERMNQILDSLSDFLAESPGLLPLAGVALILVNLLLQIFPGPGSGWFVDSNCLLHVGLILAILGILITRPITRG